MRCFAWIGLGAIAALCMAGLVGCGGPDHYDVNFGLGTTAGDGVTTSTSVDQLKDGVLPAEPGEPEKKKEGESKAASPGDACPKEPAPR